jgi:hypothetical protein
VRPPHSDWRPLYEIDLQFGRVIFVIIDLDDLHRKRSKPPTKRLTERDQWSERLRCRHCGATGGADFSQTSPTDPAYHDRTDQNVRVELTPVGFKPAVNELGCQFFCAGCGALAEHESIAVV